VTPAATCDALTWTALGMRFKVRLALYHVAKAAPDYPAQAICFLLNMPLNRGMFGLTSQK